MDILSIVSTMLGCLDLYRQTYRGGKVLSSAREKILDKQKNETVIMMKDGSYRRYLPLIKNETQADIQSRAAGSPHRIHRKLTLMKTVIPSVSSS